MERAQRRAEVLGALIDGSHGMHPDDLESEVAQVARRAGVEDLRIYLADKEQRSLNPFTPGPDAEPLAIDGTLAGRAFARVEVQTAPDVVWFPLLNGTHRVGVMRCELVPRDEEAYALGAQIAGLAAHLVVTKSSYGDRLESVQRDREMSLAAELRWSLMPPLTFMSEQIAVAGFLEPAYHVAGDAFDYALNDGRLQLAVFDAMGHGLRASRLANLALVSCRHSRRAGRGLVETYADMDRVLADQFGEDEFVTAQLVTLELATGRLEWINAGHPEPILLRDGRTGVRLGGTTSFPAGLELGPPAVSEAWLQPGDALLFHSDGVLEARSADGEEFGSDRLADLLVRAASSGAPPPEVVRRLTHAVLDHQQGSLVDDATVLLVRWPGPIQR